MKRLCYIVFLVSFFTTVHAQQLSNISASFVDIGFGARPVALGGAYIALANDVNSTLWNPAGMVSAQHPQVSFTHTNQLGMIVYNSFSAILPLNSSNQAFGVSIISSGDKALREFTGQLSYARAIGSQLRIGISAKYRNASFGNNSLSADEFILFEPDEIAEGLANQVKGSAYGFGLDVGLQYSLSPKITFAVTVKDAYAPIFWNSSTQSATNKSKGEYTEPLPLDIAVGTALRMVDNVVITSDFHPGLDKTTNNTLHSGIEAVFLQMISLRGGVQQIFSNDAKAKYMMGVGLDYGFGKNFQVLLDYSFVQESLANTQTLSLGIEF